MEQPEVIIDQDAIRGAVEVRCRDCQKEATIAFCEKHFDDVIENATQVGHEAGMEEAAAAEGV